jgi:release factor glutamine methyltransferase
LQGAKLLEDAQVSVPRLTAEVLLSHALRRDRTFLYSHPEQELSEIEWLHYGRYLHQRLGGTPTQYITRVQEFYGRPFLVTPDVLIPRPETEHVIAAALAVGSVAQADSLRSSNLRFLDVGCGSGAIAVTLQLETGAEVIAADISLPALRIAAENARRLGARISLLNCDLDSAIADRSIDVLVSNPPYVASAELAGLAREVRDHEPHVALTSGPTGFEIYERLIDGARRILRPGGHLVLELGYNSSDRVLQLLDTRFGDIRLTADLAGIPRVVSCRLLP